MQTDHLGRFEPRLGAADAPAAPPAAEPLQFTGNGGEYFGIWIVNLMLTILTFGIYSAWAKVRRLKYFYQHTRLAGAGFDYHGDPVAILKGRLIGLGLVMAYNFSPQVSWKLFLLTIILLMVAMPWLLRQSFRFRLANSSYRGLRFRFTGNKPDAYRVFLGHSLLMFFTLYLAAPLFHQRMKDYQHGNSRYGQARFSFHADAGNFYRAYGLIIGLVILLFVTFGVAMAIGAGSLPKVDGKPDPAAVTALTGMALVIIFGGTLLIQPIWEARIQNLVWNNTRLENHRFRSDISAWKLFLIRSTNLLLVLLTLGFYMPWAAVRLASYRASTLSLLPDSPIDEFLADQEAVTSATGEEAAELFDIDIGF